MNSTITSQMNFIKLAGPKVFIKKEHCFFYHSKRVLNFEVCWLI